MIITRNDKRLKKILNRGAEGESYLPVVAEILAEVKKRGDEALIHYGKTFDGWGKGTVLEVSHEEMEQAFDKTPAGLQRALLLAAKRIEDYHLRQIEKSWFYEDSEGTLLGQKITPIERAGIYAPGGTATYPSSVLMNAIPAKAAGVREIILATPAKKGKILPSVLAAAHIAGVTKVFRIGGAQAIAALAYGTKSVPRADKIAGPGNIYVALAKRLVAGVVGIDMIAGPSEVLVIADESARPKWVAADMLSQAEHDPLACAVCLTLSRPFAEALEKEIHAQLEQLTRREIAHKSIREHSCIVVVKNLEEAAELANEIAPEHLELAVESPMELLPKIRNAGAIFMGHFTPEAMGDYIAGPSHVLPTGGAARFSSPLGVYDFIKRTSIIYYEKGGFNAHKTAVETLSLAEGLTAHAESIKIRLREG